MRHEAQMTTDASGIRVGIASSAYHRDIVQALESGARSVFADSGGRGCVLQGEAEGAVVFMDESLAPVSDAVPLDQVRACPRITYGDRPEGVDRRERPGFEIELVVARTGERVSVVAGDGCLEPLDRFGLHFSWTSRRCLCL